MDKEFFMKKVFWILATIWTAALFTACEFPTGAAKTEDPVIKPAEFEPPLRAIAVAAASPLTPLDSYYDENYNYYLIDVGWVRYAYVSTLFIKHYNGVTPVTATVTSVEENTVTSTITNSVSKSITTSGTAGVKSEFTGAVKGSLFGVEVSASTKLEWNASLTHSVNDTESASELYSEVKRISNSETTSVTIGQHNEPAGHYRYALYAVCDVYFLVKTSLGDNPQLKSLETVVSARRESILPYFEYAEDGVFDNTPLDGNTITLEQDFYKGLTHPTKTTPTPPVDLVKTDSTVFVYDGDAKRIDEHTGHVHTFERPVGLDIAALKAAGYRNIFITMDVRLRAHDTGDGRSIWLDIDQSRVWERTNLNISWTKWERRTYTHTVAIDNFTNTSKFKFGFNTKSYFWNDAIWFFDDANVIFTAVK